LCMGMNLSLAFGLWPFGVAVFALSAIWISLWLWVYPSAG
jgi:hypothetical protein